MTQGIGIHQVDAADLVVATKAKRLDVQGLSVRKGLLCHKVFGIIEGDDSGDGVPAAVGAAKG